jgi:bifunctional polynucleotide phosphatase/kinase
MNLAAHEHYTLPGFHISSLPDRKGQIFTPSPPLTCPLVPSITPTSLPVIPHSGKQEVVLYCGYPALGKSRFYRQNFQPANYTHINQDTLKSRDKCIKATREALERGESCVVGTGGLNSMRINVETLNVLDNTNRDVKTRKFYVDLARKFQIPIRLVELVC